MSLSKKFCSQCGEKLPDAARFCPGCGGAISGAGVASAALSLSRASPGLRLAPFSVRTFCTMGAVTAALVTGGWYVKSNLAGVKPTVTYEEMSAKTETWKNDEGIKRLKAAAEQAPADKQAWKALAEALLSQLQRSEKPSSQLIFETIEVMRTILDLDGKDSFALLNMADISMNQQVFDKAVDYYSKYLANAPSDRLARARYASALAFTGKTDEAVKELQSVLKEEPTNFPALAYLSVTYAQMGNKSLALETGATALKNAPSDEARERFSAFLDSLENEDATKPSEKGAPKAENPRGTAGLEGVEAFIRANQVAGPKLTRVAMVDGMVAVYFKEFPMDKMPPFVRDKFTSSVVEKVKSLIPQATRVSFVDEAAGTEMVGLSVAR